MRRRDFLALLSVWPAVARSQALGDECAAVVGAPREPFAAHFKFRGSALAVLATYHTIDPQSPTIKLLKQTFASLEPAVVLVEGLATDQGTTPRGFAYSDGDPFRGGESRYAAKLALEARRLFLGIEPRDQDLNTEALKRFRPADIVGALVLRAIRAHNMTQGRPPDAVERYAERAASHYLRADPRLSNGYEDFPGWYLAAFGSQPWTDPKLIHRGSPCSKGLAGLVLKAISGLRNEHMAHVTSSVFPVTPSVLLVFGAGHYRALAPLLAARYGAPRYETV